MRILQPRRRVTQTQLSHCLVRSPWSNPPFWERSQRLRFFAKLAPASNGSQLKVFDVLLNADASSAAAHFRYDWTLASGDVLRFERVGLFYFAPEGAFARLAIYYDTYPLREEVGDKYANA